MNLYEALSQIVMKLSLQFVVFLSSSRLDKSCDGYEGEGIPGLNSAKVEQGSWHPMETMCDLQSHAAPRQCCRRYS